MIKEKLNNPDKLVTAAQRSLTSREYRKSRFPGMFCTSWGNEELDIMVSPNNFNRALLFMDKFIKEIKKRGHGVVVQHDRTNVLMYEEKFQIRLREKTKKVKINDNPWPRSEYRPTGILYLKIEGSYPFSEKRWEDGSSPLERLLRPILDDLERKCVTLREQRLESEKERRLQEEQEKLRQELQSRRKIELQNFRDLLIKSERWHKAMRLRNYIAELERGITGGEENQAHLNDWISWAKEKVDWYDPFIEKQDELLNKIERDSLAFGP